jgi:predicted flap endonuclease-1-like 5' DNA nuclease
MNATQIQIVTELVVMLGVSFVLGILLKHFWNTSKQTSASDTAEKVQSKVEPITLKKETVVANNTVNVFEYNSLKSELAESKAMIASMQASPNNSDTLEIINREMNLRVTEIASLKSEISTLKAELNTCQAEKNGLLQAMNAKANNLHKDDLKKIEGVGPKIQQILNEAGIYTFSDLSNSSTERLKEILKQAGDKYRIHDPKTWSQQAKMAAEGRWDELNALQEVLKGGK